MKLSEHFDLSEFCRKGETPDDNNFIINKETKNKINLVFG